METVLAILQQVQDERMGGGQFRMNGIGPPVQDERKGGQPVQEELNRGNPFVLNIVAG